MKCIWIALYTLFILWQNFYVFYVTINNLGPERDKSWLDYVNKYLLPRRILGVLVKNTQSRYLDSDTED